MQASVGRSSVQVVRWHCQRPFLHSTRTLCRPLPQQQRNWIYAAGEGETSNPAVDASHAAATAPAGAQEEETTFYEGSGAPAELVISLLLGLTLVYLPLTMAAVGRRLWVKYKFTNKRLIVITSSPVFEREVQILYSQIKEIRTAPRAFGLWGDMVVFLKDGSRLEIVGLERCYEVRDYIYGRMLAK